MLGVSIRKVQEMAPPDAFLAPLSIGQTLDFRSREDLSVDLEQEALVTQTQGRSCR